ncbi:unnamed protein product [Cuscuta epithymum]|uniref:FBD domain-containing protein n=1 Tax=Cuscuta epithymum TaxID=186058 RepID=A0AAV0ELS1_9ASTE|nr:unnamed protein product [Cuscuta epithymum]
MAAFLPSENELDGDRISQLPADVKDMIMECLDTRDAARVGVLSTQWKDVWLRHGCLVFDSCFFRRKPSTFVNMVTNTLMLRSGPVRKFEFVNAAVDVRDSWCKPKQSDVDQWCLILSRIGIEQLTISVVNLTDEGYYNLPQCIISCSTLKRLKLAGFLFYCSVNARLSSIFTNVTSLVFVGVVFIHIVHGSTISIVPNLEELVFEACQGIHNFLISAPKLKSLTVFSGYVAEWKWFQLHFPVTKSLSLSLDTLSDPLSVCWVDERPSLWEDPLDGGFIIDHDLDMLKTVSIDSFFGYKREELFVKAILSKSPVLEELVIRQSAKRVDSVASKFRNEMHCFPRASSKVRIVINYM